MAYAAGTDTVFFSATTTAAPPAPMTLIATVGGRVRAFDGHSAPTVAVRFSRDGRLIASASFDGTAKVWDRESGRLVTLIDGHTQAYLLTDPQRSRVHDSIGYARWPVGPGGRRESGPRKNNLFLHVVKGGPAGGGFSTVEDLLKWDQGLYTEKILSKKSLEAMFTANKNDYGYGWVIRTQNGRRTVGHGGGIEGFNTMIQRYPDDRLVVIVLSNINTPVTGRMANDLAAIAFGEKYELPRERKAITVDSKILNRYIGRYVFSPQFAIEVTREGDRLMGQATNQPKVEMFAETETVFFLKVVDAEMRFVTDENGIPQEMILTQGGREMRGKRESN